MSLVWFLVLRAARRTSWWWTAYSAYLRSASWKRRRARCLDAAGGLCSSCRVAKATQAHHTSYLFVGCEPQRHLKALCRRCHSIAHGRSL